MQPEGFYDALTPNPPVIITVFLMGVAMILLPRKYALFPMFLVAMYVTLGQVIVIATANFTMLRLLVVFGLARMAVRGDYARLTLNKIDAAMIAWAISSIVTYAILWQSVHSLVNRMGMCFDTVGVYFLCRFYLDGIEDVARIFKLCVALMVPLALAMIWEFVTDKNVFSFLGGVPPLSEIRNGHVRAQGSFRHPILMGTFGATMLPPIIALWWDKSGSKYTAIFGAAACVVIVGCSGSSGAAMASLYGIAALFFWYLRDHMRSVRWGIVLALVVLQLVMKAPFWYILSRMSSITGGTGWHRAYLIDQAIRYLNEWWLVGTKVTAHWMPTGLLIDPTRADITNQYLSQGVNGGLITMAIYIMIIVFGFAAVGSSVRARRDNDFSEKIFIWSMGAALFAHVVSFLSVSYFDQIEAFWYFLMAAIAVVSLEIRPVSEPDGAWPIYRGATGREPYPSKKRAGEKGQIR
jgi:hypothetical protein